MPEARILIVEDEAIESMDLQQRLIAMGYPLPAIAHNGEEGVMMAEKLRPDLILMDIMMPKMDGITAAEQIKPRFDIPIIFLTAYADENTLNRAKVTAPYGYIIKPFQEREFHIAVDIALYRHKMDKELRARDKEISKLNCALGCKVSELEIIAKELEAYSYSVSHDLKAPLRSIEGFTKAIVEDYATKLDETATDYFRRVISASHRMSQLIEALLTMSRLTQVELHENMVNLSDIAKVAVDELKKKNPDRKADFVIAMNIRVNGDFALLRIALESLLDNAWKFTSKKPRAKIEFGVKSDMSKGTVPDLRTARSAVVESGLSPSEKNTVYFVRDNGAGFDMKYADKLFRPFQRLHQESEFSGLGIGLATAQKIIARHCGNIWAESEPEKGATFYFTLG